ncbi:MAG: Zn-ribbon containing protein [Candidatus Woesearchaeota archaeon]
MIHRCTKCKVIYENDDDVLRNGCICGNTRFYFRNKKKTTQRKNASETQITETFYEPDDEENNEIIIFDTETINIIEDGKYEIDLNSLMTNTENVVYRYGDGKYSVDIEEGMKNTKRK